MYPVCCPYSVCSRLSYCPAGGYSNVANKASTAQGSVSVASSQLTSLPASVQQWLSQAAAANDELQSRSGSIASQQGQVRTHVILSMS
jgi:hypothetical protein